MIGYQSEEPSTSLGVASRQRWTEKGRRGKYKSAVVTSAAFLIELESAVMAAVDDLKSWFERDLRFATWGENAQVDDADLGRVVIRFYTDTNEYELVLTTSDAGASLINVAVKSRKPRAGLSASRTRRLFPSDRIPLNEKAWRRLLACIVGLELVRVHRPEGTDEPPRRLPSTPARPDDRDALVGINPDKGIR